MISAYEVGGIQAADADPSSVSQQRSMLFRSPDLPTHLSGTLKFRMKESGAADYK